MRKINFFFSLFMSLLLFSCGDDYIELDKSSKADNSKSINQKAQIDGVKYSLDNIVVSPNIVVLNSENTIVKSSETELQNGIFNLEILSQELISKLNIGNVLYYQSNNQSFLRKVKSVNVLEPNNYYLDTEEAFLGDLFESGSLELSIDVEETDKILKMRKSSIIKSNNTQGLTFDIFNYVNEYKQDALTFNPSTTVKAFFNVKVGFDQKSKILPNELVVTYEIQTSMNPYFKFTKPLNQEYSFDLIDNVPSDILNQIKNIEVSVDIPLGDLGTLPALVSLEQIKFPGKVIVNASKESNFGYNVNGNFKVGYAFYNKIAGKQSHFIYENTMLTKGINNFDLNGEALSNMEIILIPKISLVNTSLINVSGQVVFGLSTVSNGGISSETNKFVTGSKGEFYSSGKFTATSLGLNLFTTDLFNNSKELWNVGTLNNKVLFSNLKISKPDKSYCDLRSYSYEMTLDYKYPILGKRISGNLEMTYDVYDDTRKLLKANEKVIISPRDLNKNSFKFNLCIPFKVDALGFTSGFTKKMAYIRNIVIKDNLGNTCVGILNPKTNQIYNEIELGSPYNTSFWK